MSRDTPFLPFDVIYKIYFYVDDYCTANNFLLLCKYFRINYMRKEAYLYKFNILYQSLFSFFMLLPETFNNSDNIGDLTFYELIMCQSKNYYDKTMLRKDIHFVYNLYKNFFIYYFANDNDKNTIKIAKDLSNIIILQGPRFINNLVTIKCNSNNVPSSWVKVSVKSKFKNRSQMLGYILEHYNRYNLKLIKTQILLLKDE
jgi:hypothetical protein